MKYSIQKLWLTLVCMIMGTAAWGQDLQLCTSTSDLVAGGIYYIGTSATILEDTWFMEKSAINRAYFPQTRNPNNRCELILGGNATEGWTFSYQDGQITYFLYSTENKRDLQITLGQTDYCNFSIDFDTKTQVAKIKSVKKADTKFIRHDTNKQGFACYNEGYQSTFDIYLYKKVGIIPIAAACTDGTKCYSTYSNASAWVVPKDLSVAEIGIENNILNVKEYAEGDIVPANTGVMVSASAGGNYTVDLTTETGTSVLGDANRLRPSGPSGITADAMVSNGANCLYYRLTMHNGTQIGFWWGAENGAAFPLAANKAYLAVPQTATSAKMGMWFGSEGDPTAINATGSKPAEAAIYNLHGQHISHLQKGVNIVEGKKIIR